MAHRRSRDAGTPSNSTADRRNETFMTKAKKTVQKSASVTEKEAACAAYIDAVNDIYRKGNGTEVSYRDALSPLLRTLLPNRGVTNEPKPMERNKPDYTITSDPDGGLLIAIVETKKIGAGDLAGKKDSGYKEQFDRYKAAYQTIAFTDFLDFHFYGNGALSDSVRIGEVVDDGIRPLAENFGKFVALIERLGDAEPQTITSPTQLAQLMAAKARLLQVAAQKFLSSGNAKGSTLWELLEGFKRVLMPDTNADEFSDIYAQTLTYGMFAARLHDDTPEDFSREEAARLIPKSNPFLRKLFNHINSDIEDEIKWPVDDIVRLFAAADVRGIMKDYGKSKKRSDPMIHFYEDFLNAYDAGLRKDRGVWYTPLPVVRFIVRAVDDILVKRFGIADGIASRDMVQIEVTENCDTGKSLTKKVKKTVPKVQVLDPATGTGTFLAECINRIYGKFLANKGKWPGYVAENLIPRLNGFELLMAPYTMAHIKLDRVLADTGYEHNTDKRFNIFLTNSLEKAKDLGGTLFDILLGAEANAANAVKRDCPVMVVMGNPPYSGESQNKGDLFKDFMELMNAYKKEPGGKEKLKERNPKWLNDDYVKFIRLAQDYVERKGEGILAYINPHGFLDNPTFRGMRWNLLNAFDEIYVLNLHGNAKRHEVCPDGSKDENVFTIMQGVSINVFVKTGKKPAGALGKVYYADLWGTRKDKYKFLESTGFADVAYEEVKPVTPMYFFVPKNTKGKGVYENGFSMKELFIEDGMGVTSAHDTFAYGDYDTLVHRFTAFKNSLAHENLYAKFNVREKAGWDIVKAHKALQRTNNISDSIRPMTYRPFDDTCVFYDDTVVWRSVRKIFNHFIAGENIGLCLIRINSRDNNSPVFVTDKITDKTILSSKDNANVFPLYLYHDTLGKVEKVPNLDKDVVTKIEESLRASASPSETKTSPESIFDYIYAVLHTPEYRERYREFLKVDFPRIPYPTDADTFRKLSKIGGELRELHLLKTKSTASERNRIANFPKGGSNAVEDVRFADGKVYINDGQYFDHMNEADFGFFIGGYQPAQKWLKDRKGRTLTNADIDHYQAIILALSRTRTLMQKLSALSKEWLA